MQVDNSRSWHVFLPDKYQVHAAMMSLAILVLALLILWLGHWIPSSVSKEIIVREVSLMSAPPPPPPPPPLQQQMRETQVNMQVQGAGAVIPQIDVKQKIEVITPDLPTIQPRKAQWQSLEVDWNALDLNQLDGLPNLLTPVRVTFPKSLSRKGIRRVMVKLDVVIDEKGQVTLVNIVENPHPELEGEIQRLVRNSRFSAPKKDNQAVRARFIWPVDIGS